jgi:hypothetical protein
MKSAPLIANRSDIALPPDQYPRRFPVDLLIPITMAFARQTLDTNVAEPPRASSLGSPRRRVEAVVRLYQHVQAHQLAHRILAPVIVDDRVVDQRLLPVLNERRSPKSSARTNFSNTG